MKKAVIDNLRGRSALEVFEDHLRLAGEHEFKEEIERNASPDIVIFERRGIFRGRDEWHKTFITRWNRSRPNWKTRDLALRTYVSSSSQLR